MGDAADDVFDSYLQDQLDHDLVVKALLLECPKQLEECAAIFAQYNDDGLIECPVCKRVTDV